MQTDWDIKVVKCGTKAKFGDINGVICSIEITYSNILYKFGYFDKDLNYKTIWVHEKEVSFNAPKRQKVGFFNNEQ